MDSFNNSTYCSLAGILAIVCLRLFERNPKEFASIPLVVIGGSNLLQLEPDGTEVELASTFRVFVLRTAEMELSHNNY